MDTRLEAARRACARARAIAERGRAIDAELARVLREIDDCGHWATLGYESLGAFGEKELEIPVGKAKELVALAKKLDALPQTREAFEAGTIGWTKCRQIARVATVACERKWIDDAKTWTNRELEREVALAKGERPVRHVTIPMTEEQYLAYERAARAIREERGEALSAGEVVGIMAARAVGAPVEKPASTIVIHECPTCGETSRDTREGRIPVDGATLAAARSDATIVDLRKKRSRTSIPRGLRAKVVARDGNRCAYCRSPSWGHVHHLVPRCDDMDLLLLLCSTCHDRLVHGGHIRIVPLGGGRFDFRLKDGSIPGKRVGPFAVPGGP